MTSFIGAYTGFHRLTFKRNPCAGGDCSLDAPATRVAARSPLAVAGRSYWTCKACTQAASLQSLANTIRSGDKQRLSTGLRLERMYRGAKYVPLMVSKQDADVINRFKAGGGVASNHPAHSHDVSTQ